MTYEQLVLAIGPGFHPDERGKDYESLPDGITPAEVDRIVMTAFNESAVACDGDPYDRALDTFIRNGWA